MLIYDGYSKHTYAVKIFDYVRSAHEIWYFSRRFIVLLKMLVLLDPAFMFDLVLHIDF